MVAAKGTGLDQSPAQLLGLSGVKLQASHSRTDSLHRSTCVPRMICAAQILPGLTLRLAPPTRCSCLAQEGSGFNTVHKRVNLLGL